MVRLDFRPSSPPCSPAIVSLRLEEAIGIPPSALGRYGVCVSARWTLPQGTLIAVPASSAMALFPAVERHHLVAMVRTMTCAISFPFLSRLG